MASGDEDGMALGALESFFFLKMRFNPNTIIAECMGVAWGQDDPHLYSQIGGRKNGEILICRLDDCQGEEANETTNVCVVVPQQQQAEEYHTTTPLK